jgi:hypothetical protein
MPAGGTMHPRLKKRIEMISKEREQALYASLAGLADTFEVTEGFPPVLGRALRQLAWALSTCSADAQGQLTKLRLLKVTLPVLNDIMSAVASQYRTEAAALLTSMSSLLEETETQNRIAGGKGPAGRSAGRNPT